MFVNRFKLEYESDNEWVQHGEHETGIKPNDDIQMDHHIKLEQPVVGSKIRIIIEDHMVE